MIAGSEFGRNRLAAVRTNATTMTVDKAKLEGDFKVSTFKAIKLVAKVAELRKQLAVANAANTNLEIALVRRPQ